MVRQGAVWVERANQRLHHAEIIALKGSSFRTRGKEQAIPSTVPRGSETH